MNQIYEYVLVFLVIYQAFFHGCGSRTLMMYLMKFQLTLEGLLVSLANHYTNHLTVSNFFFFLHIRVFNSLGKKIIFCNLIKNYFPTKIKFGVKCCFLRKKSERQNFSSLKFFKRKNFIFRKDEGLVVLEWIEVD